jgi:hypothetical protein
MRGAVRYVVFLCASLALNGCGHDPFSPTEAVELAQARARWAGAGLTDYQFDIRVGCFCIHSRIIFTRLEVRAGAVVSATPLGEPHGGSEIPLSAWPTVADAFATIDAAAGGSDYRDIQASYDEVLGYPKRVNLQCEADILDCGLTYELENLQPR